MPLMPFPEVFLVEEHSEDNKNKQEQRCEDK